MFRENLLICFFVLFILNYETFNNFTNRQLEIVLTPALVP